MKFTFQNRPQFLLMLLIASAAAFVGYKVLEPGYFVAFLLTLVTAVGWVWWVSPFSMLKPVGSSECRNV